MNDLPVASGAGLASFGPPPLLTGENPALYDDLLARICGAVKPADIFEELWVRDLADLAWEVSRLRRLKAQLLRACAYEGLEDVLDPLVSDTEEYHALTKRWTVGDAAAAETVDKTLAAAGLTMDAVMAQALTGSIEVVERIERMMAAAEARRDTVLHEIERRRAGLARRLHRAIREVEDAEFKVIAPAPSEAAE